MRPSEVAALTLSACELPEDGWGWLSIADASTTAGRAYTDDGLTHEHRGLKGRTRGRPGTRARKPTRRIPAPPELVAMLGEHIARFGAGPDGRVFRSERGNPIQASTWWQVWQKVRAASLTPGQLDGPLMIQPYCLRHAGVTRRLNEGVDEATVAAWAGHSVEVLRRIYHHSVGGQDDVLIARMDAHRRRSLWGNYGAHMGHGIRHLAASAGNAWHPLTPPGFTSTQVRGRFRLVMMSAPSRIRTCAHGSGGRCRDLANFAADLCQVDHSQQLQPRSVRPYSGSSRAECSWWRCCRPSPFTITWPLKTSRPGSVATSRNSSRQSYQR